LNWFLYALLGGVCFGVHAVLVQTTLTSRFTAMVVNTYFFTLGAVMLWSYSIIAGTLPIPDAKTVGKLLLVALVAVVGFWGVFKGYESTPNLGYVRAVFSVNVLVAFVLSAVLFGMQISSKGVLGMALILAGTVLLAMA
jgi:drug/metabolite transporter (DMT)-like permease